MAKRRFKFPEGIEQPALLIAFAKLVDSCKDYVSGDFELSDDDACSWFHGDTKLAAQFAIFGHDGMDSLYGFWLQAGQPIDKSPIVYLNGEGSDNTVLASSLREFLGLLGHNYDCVGMYRSWDPPEDPSNEATHRRFLGWLKARRIAVSTRPKAVVTAARKAHPDLDKWLKKKLSQTAAPKSVKALVPTAIGTKLAESLCQAAEDGDVTEVKRLLAAGAKVNPKLGPMERAPLTAAAGAGQREVVEVLLSAGAKVDLEAFLWAAWGGELQLVKMALAQGLSANAKNLVSTPLTRAAESGRTEIVRLLLDHGADPNLRNPDGQLPLVEAAGGNGDTLGTLALLRDRGAAIEGRDKLFGRTAFLNAVFRFDAEPILRFLAKRGANVNARDDRKRSALQMATDPKVKAVLKKLL